MSSQVRLRHPRLDWIVFSREAFHQFVEMARKTHRYPAAKLSHLGALFGEFVRTSRDVHRVLAYTDRQARFIASNGGTIASFQLAQKCGQTQVKYLDERRYISAEFAVLNVWQEEANPSFDAKATRVRIWIAEGLDRSAEQQQRVRFKLATDFNPFSVPVQMEMGFPKPSRIELGRRKGPVPPAKHPRSSVVTYRIVDLDDYTRRLHEANQADPNTAPVSSGELFRASTALGDFSGRTPLDAVDLFRRRVAGGMNAVLPPSRFTAVPLTLWNRAVASTVLPRIPTAKTLRTYFAVLRRSRLERERYERLERADLARSDPWGLVFAPTSSPATSRSKRLPKSRMMVIPREPGLDFEVGEQLHLPLQTWAQLLEFPPKEPRDRLAPVLVVLTTAQRSWVPTPFKVAREMVQLEFDFQIFRLTSLDVPDSQTYRKKGPRKARPRPVSSGQGNLF